MKKFVLIRLADVGIILFLLWIGAYGTVSVWGEASVQFNWSFESGTFDGWKVMGEAFGTKPDDATLAGQFNVQGYEGKYYANSFHGGDQVTGKLISPVFILQEKYVNFLIYRP